MDNKAQEKRTAMAILLSIVVIVVYNTLFMPKPRPQPVKSAAVVQPAAETNNTTPPPPPTITAATPQNSAATALPVTGNPTRIPTKIEYEQSPVFSIETDLYVATFTNLGGRLKSFRLKNYQTSLENPKPLNVVTIEDNIYPLGVYVAGTQDAATMYTIPETGVTAGAKLQESTYSLPTSGELSVVLQGQLPNGIAIKKTLRFVRTRYTVDVSVSLGQPSPDGSPVWLEWTEFADLEDAASRSNPKQFVSLENDGNDTSIVRTMPDSLEGSTQQIDSKWTAFGDSYFQAVMLNQQAGLNTAFGQFGNTFFIRSRGDTDGGVFSLYIGPKDRNLLRDYGQELYKTIDLGWFSFVGEPVLNGIHFLYGILGNYGLAIVALTLLLKTALLPLTKTSFKSMKAMQDLQPEIKALRERVKDPNQLNQEVMALYKKRGANPLGGCFPMLLQMPIFLGMYNALQRDIDLRHSPFALWVNDLSAPEGLEIFGIAVPVMILLMGASMLFQQITTPTAADPAQKKAMYAVPIIFTGMFVVFPFPSGLVLYWLTNNLISIVQQVALRSEEGANPLKATVIGSVVVFVVAFVLTLF